MKLYLARTSLLVVVILSACQGQQAPDSRNGSGDATNKKTTPPIDTPTGPNNPPTPTDPNVGGAAASCDDQWTQHVALFKVGVQTSYASKISSPAFSFLGEQPLIHSEKVTASSQDGVTSAVTLQSSNQFVQTALTQIKLPPTITITKLAFVSSCKKAGNKGAATTTFQGGNVQVLDSRDESVTVPAGTFNTQYMKLDATVTASGSNIHALIDVWLSKDQPGLVVKQVANLSNVPVANQATFTDELQSKIGL